MQVYKEYMLGGGGKLCEHFDIENYGDHVISTFSEYDCGKEEAKRLLFVCSHES